MGLRVIKSEPKIFIFPPVIVPMGVLNSTAFGLRNSYLSKSTNIFSLLAERPLSVLMLSYPDNSIFFSVELKKALVADIVNTSFSNNEIVPCSLCKEKFFFCIGSGSIESALKANLWPSSVTPRNVASMIW